MVQSGAERHCAPLQKRSLWVLTGGRARSRHAAQTFWNVDYYLLTSSTEREASTVRTFPRFSYCWIIGLVEFRYVWILQPKKKHAWLLVSGDSGGLQSDTWGKKLLNSQQNSSDKSIWDKHDFLTEGVSTWCRLKVKQKNTEDICFWTWPFLQAFSVVICASTVLPSL